MSSVRPTSRPPRRVEFALTHFRLGEIRVLDVGCGEGSHLQHFGTGSVGLEIQRDSIARGRSHGRDIRPWDFSDGFPAELEGGFDAIWCSNLLEHVPSPHTFLLDARRLLRPRGLLLAVVPMTKRCAVGPWRFHRLLGSLHRTFSWLRRPLPGSITPRRHTSGSLAMRLFTGVETL